MDLNLGQQNVQPNDEGWDAWPNQQVNDPNLPANGVIPNALDQAGAQNNFAANVVQVLIVAQQLPGEPFLELNDLIQAPGIDFDLNQALEDDLGGIEDLNQAVDNLEGNQVVVEGPVQIIDACVFIDEEPTAINQIQLQDNHVEVFIPNHPIMPEEIQVEELMDHQPVEDEFMPEAHDVNDDPPQLGFVELFEPHQDPVFSTFRSLHKNNAEAFRLWAKYIAPGHSQPSTLVPNAWVDFLTALLGSPNSFSWARQFLSSPSWDIITSKAN
jgi:hypothetical protein